MQKVAFVFGTRPEYIKIAPVVSAFRKDGNFDVKLIFTNQHKTMVDDFFPIFKEYPDIKLKIEHDGNLSNLTGNIIKELDVIFKKENFDIVFVHGDTTSTFCGGLAAFYNKIKIAHIEAGLRSFDMQSPFPEEMNRKYIGLVADYHFCATEISKENIEKEGSKGDVFVTGNTSIDAIKWVFDLKLRPSDIVEKAFEGKNLKYALLTSHRRENLDKLDEIFTGIKEILNLYKNLKIILPMHLNPLAKSKALEYFKDENRVVLTEPLNYIDIAFAMSKSNFIITDSGGLQEEGTYFKIPILVLRKSTERPEGLSLGFSRLTPNSQDLKNAVSDIFNEKFKISSSVMPYGDGNASQKILNIVKNLK
jgi:UDP-N-acetylglucosamine 2-epimerase (non-hydrolysing)